MFRLSKQERERQKALDKALVERIVDACTKDLLIMQDAKPEPAERLHKSIKDRLKEPKLPRDFKQQVRDLAKQLEMASNMRAAGHALQMAMLHGKADRKLERSAFIKEGRAFARKAKSLGAGEKFQNSADMLIETIMMSGNVSARGKATRAKPVNKNAPPPDLAKVDDEKLQQMVREKLSAIRATLG